MRLLASAFMATALTVSATAADAAERHRLNIPGGRLGDALVALGRQTGISVGVSDPALANEVVRPVRGTFTVEQALRRLLRGSNARHVMIDAVTVRIVRRPPPRRVRPAPVPPRAAPPASPAPPPQEEVEEEIIVTASRRPLPLRFYPGSVALVGGNDPALTGIRGTEAIVSRLPSLTSTHLGPGRNKLFVRGIADSSFNGPTQATVGQYIGETRLNYNAPDPDLRLYDVERIEVLAGPQGTLYGAGSLGGIVKIVPNAPDLDRNEIIASAGTSATAHGDAGLDAAATVNLARTDGGLGVRLNAYAVSEGGYIDDTLRGLDDVNRVRIFGGRAAVRSLPDDHWTIDVSAVGQIIRGEDAQFADEDRAPLTRQSPVQQNFSNDYLLAGAVAAREWDDFRLVASTGLVRQTLHERYDTTPVGSVPAVYDLTTRISFLSADVRLSRGRPGGAGWVAGATILGNRSDQTRDVDFLSGTSPRNRVENDIVEAAVYGEATARIVPDVTATFGGRLSAVHLSSSGFAFVPGFPLPPSPESASRGETRFLPTAAVAAQAAPDLLLYARYQQSFRPGGLAIFGAEFNRFQSDTVAAFEGGIRYGAPGQGVFDAAAAVAYTRWSDIQADVIDILAEPTTANIGDARIYTLDLTIGWRPLRGLAMEAAAVLNESERYNLPPGLPATGSPPLPGVARFNGRVAAHYAFAPAPDMNLRLSAAARYTGRSFLSAGDFLMRPQGNWLDVALGAQLDAGRHAFTLDVTNLLDSAASRFALGSPLTGYQQNHVTPVRPRTVRVGWEVRF